MRTHGVGCEEFEVNLSTAEERCGWSLELFDRDPYTLSFGNVLRLLNPKA